MTPFLIIPLEVAKKIGKKRAIFRTPQLQHPLKEPLRLWDGKTLGWTTGVILK